MVCWGNAHTIQLLVSAARVQGDVQLGEVKYWNIMQCGCRYACNATTRAALYRPCVCNRKPRMNQISISIATPKHYTRSSTVSNIKKAHPVQKRNLDTVITKALNVIRHTVGKRLAATTPRLPPSLSSPSILSSLLCWACVPSSSGTGC